MAKKLDIDKYLSEKKGKPINPLVYKILNGVIGKPMASKMKLEVVDNVGTDKLKGPFVVLVNHTSRCDWQYIGRAFRKTPLNFMASNIEFHRSHMHFIFKLTRIIPKKNFVSDMHAIKEVMQIIEAGGNVVFFPEGKSSISGTNQPIMTGSGQLLKHLNVPVYTATITGGYMSNTQWYIKDRVGKVIITVNKLFTPEETQNLSGEEMEDRINEALYNDDFVWNETARVQYSDMADIATKLNEHIFWCPKCGKELTMKGEGNVFKCAECGNGTKINEFYDFEPLSDDAVLPKNLRIWYELQRRKIYREIKDNPEYTLIEENVVLGEQPTDHYVDKTVTSEPIGEGTIKLTRDEFVYTGTAHGEPFELRQKIIGMPSVVFSTDSHYFGAFFKGKYYEFTPKRPVCTKWLLAIEECHRAAGGRWKNTIRQQQWIYEDDKDTDKENYYL